MKALTACLTTTGVFAAALGFGAEKETNPPLDLPSLVPFLRKHQAPEPPLEAPFVLVHTHTWSVVGNRSDSRDPAQYTPAFLLETKADGQIVVLRGFNRVEVRKVRKSEPLTRPFSLEQPKPMLGGHVSLLSGTDCFITAIQLGARGDADSAQALWQRCQDSMARRDVADAKHQRQELALAIFGHLLGAAREGTLDWSVARDRMKLCLTDFPSIGGDARDERSPRSILASIELAVKAKPAKAGSIEDLLIKWSRIPCPTEVFGLWNASDAERYANHELARQIVLQGYAAIPELERLADDRRFTARETPAMMMSAACPVMLGELAGLLLKELRGSLKSIKGVAEADELAAAAFEYKGRHLASLHETPLRILAAKYPERLPPMCEEFTRKAPGDLQPYDLAEAVASSTMPKARRVSALVEFAKRGSLEHRRCILQNLAKLDELATSQLLLPILQKLPKDADGAYWTCAEANFTHVVMQFSDAIIWRAYLEAAKRAAIGLKMEMMNPMNYSYIGDKGRDLRLAFLASFLDDDGVRDQSKNAPKYDGPCAAFTFPKIEVRNFAAMQAASILELEEEPDEHWDSRKWHQLRGKVRTRLMSMNLPNLAP